MRSPKFTFLILLLLQLFATIAQAKYTIKGKVNLYNDWQPQVYLASIEKINDYYRASADLVINIAPIQVDGTFILEGDNLPNENRFYRLYLMKQQNREYDACLFVGGEDHNFVHVVLNNAGVNRDRMFASMTEQEWDTIMAVHLKGHFCISSNAVQYWRNLSKEGKAVDARIINTTSGAGLQGSIGQSNYAAAKAGIAALTLNQAAELGRYGITANAIAPAARTGMTNAVESMAEMMKKPEDGSFDYWAPENVSTLLAWIASSESAHVTGRCFESEGGKISIADGWRSTKGLDKGDQWKPSELKEAVDKLIAEEVPAQKVYGS